MEKKKTRKNRKSYGPKNRPEGNNFSKSKKTGGKRQEAEGRTPARKVTVKPGPMLYPLPSVMVSCGTMENSNIITVGWTGIVNTDPPMTYVSIRKSRFSHQIIRETGEFVINLTSADLTRWCDYCGVKSGRNVDKFKETGKVITMEQATKICDITDNLSSYVQHLAWIIWYKSGKVVTNEDIDSAVNDLLEQNRIFFQREVEQLSELQMNFLRAVASGITTGHSSKEVIKKYRLESSANVNAIKKALLKKDIIDIEGQAVTINDSLFKLWINRQQFFD